MDSSASSPAPGRRPASSPRPRVRLRAPGDLLDAVPFLLGFHPTDSLVALGLRGQRQRVWLTLRMDLPPVDDRKAVAEAATCVRDAMVGERLEACVLIAYLGAGQGGPVGVPAVVLAAGEAVEASGLRVHDAIVVAQGRWRSVVCRDPSCCPPEGRPYDPRSGSLVGAELAYAGLSAAPSREARVAALGPGDEDRRAGLAALVAQYSAEVVLRLADPAPLGKAVARDGLRVEGLGLINAAISRYRTGREPPATGRLDDREAARLLAVLAADVCLRDAAYERSVSASGASRVAARACWADLVRRAPAGVVAPVATVLGLLAWEDGDGLTAQIAADRALDDDPGYRMAVLLDTLIAHRVREDSGPVVRAIRRQAAGWGRLSGVSRGSVGRTG